ncbi:MAG: endolytic transglycosylase MltG [Gilvibacter sp.]
MNLKKVVLAILLVGVLVGAVFSYYIYNTIFGENTAFNNEVAHIYIPTDATFSDVLEDISPLLKNVDSFVTTANKKGYSSNVKPGHYTIEKGMNNNEIINSIRSNNIPVTVRFNNQERLENLAGRIANQLEADSLSLLNSMKDPAFLSANGFSEQTALAMYVPNSYELYWNSSPEQFRDKMLQGFTSFWNDERIKKASDLGLTKQEVVSLAAIVQKETAKVDERPRVAGVYVNRIKRGMPLQADPTVIYAKKLTENNFDQTIKRVLYRDLEIDSPYNTYKNTGVPPGPITMPDISALNAVLNYEKHDYIFFVANVQKFGYHKFAKTLAQHNRNKQEYVQWINSQGVNR